MINDPAFTKEILATECAIMDMGRDPTVAQVWSLSGAPLEVQIGADIECYIREKETGLKISEVSQKKRKSLFTAIANACGQQLCKRPIVDSESLELNPLHGNPSFIIKNYLLLAQKIRPIAENHGWNFAMGAGHWHLSLKDPKRKTEGLSILNQNKDTNRAIYTPFAEELSRNLVNLMALTPALFLRPSRSEKSPQGPLPITRILSHGATRRSVIRMNGDIYPNTKFRMYEMRAANLAPVTPVLLLLHAVARTFWQKPIRIENYKPETTKLRPNALFIRGQGCFLTDLETTKTSGYLDRHFPHLKDPWLKACVQSYKDYLENPTRTPAHTPETRAAALAKLAII